MPNQAQPRAHILLIDDEMAICIGVCGLLETVGFAASYALDAQEGLLFLEAHPETDVVLLDINLGAGKTGIEILPEIRQRFKCVQVMMFTSHDTLSTGLECMKKGAADYLTKPFNEKDFLKKIPEVLAKKNLARLNELYFGILIHDLKNPLQIISGAWELSKTYLPKTLSDSQQRIISTCNAGVLQMRIMVGNILGVVKFEAGSFAPSREKFPLRQNVDATLAPLHQQMVSSNKTFNVLFEENTPTFLVSDKDLFARVLFNVVSNAMRYTPEKGAIAVTFCEAQKGFVQTTVSNTGSFIDEIHREAIFDKFSSVQMVEQSAGIRNFGLGLTFSKMAVEAMGGGIRVESDKDIPQTSFVYTVKNHEGS